MTVVCRRCHRRLCSPREEPTALVRQARAGVAGEGQMVLFDLEETAA